MSSPVALLFEQELTRRGVPFRIESETERYVIEHRDLRLFVSLENVSREFARDGDESHVTKFIDSVRSPSSECRTWEEAQKSILFCFEPTDHVKAAFVRAPEVNAAENAELLSAGRGLVAEDQARIRSITTKQRLVE